MKKERTRIQSEVGASTLAYAILVAVLIPVFLAAGFLFTSSSKQRGEEAVESSEYMIPCGGKLSGAQCR